MSNANQKDLNDIWDAIRSIRADIKKLQDADTALRADFLRRSYESITEKLEIIQADVDTLKSK